MVSVGSATILSMHNPLASAEFLVMEFDHAGGGLSVVDGVTYSPEESSREHARPGPRGLCALERRCDA